jgi:DNA-binding response OmpR family regulator
MAVQADESGPALPLLQGAMRILFVDDDPILREFAVVNLTTDEVLVDAAGDGRSTLEAIEAATPDVVLLDLEMPDLDGFDVLARLRADPRWQALPVIVVTGREDIDAVDRAFEAGATSFAVKPLNWRLLSHQLRYVHRAARNERAMAQGQAAAAGQLVRLAAEGAHFIAAALAREPGLKGAAVSFAKVADAALKRDAAACAA